MASGRRGGPPDFKSTLGSLLRTTLEQVGAVKDVVEQQARGRGGILDQALLQRRRKEALTRLGESVYRLSRRGELGELALDPEIGMALAEVDAAESEGARDDDHLESIARRSGAEAVSSSDYRPAHSRTADDGEYRVWRPVMPEDPASDEHHEVDTQQDLAAPDVMTEPPAEEPKLKRPSRMTRKSAQRSSGGGIQFVSEDPRPGDDDCDDDLEGYMHDDDVPE